MSERVSSRPSSQGPIVHIHVWRHYGDYLHYYGDTYITMETTYIDVSVSGGGPGRLRRRTGVVERLGLRGRDCPALPPPLLLHLLPWLRGGLGSVRGVTVMYGKEVYTGSHWEYVCLILSKNFCMYALSFLVLRLGLHYPVVPCCVASMDSILATRHSATKQCKVLCT